MATTRVTEPRTVHLAIDGGEPFAAHEFAPYRPHGEQEKAAVRRVVDSGVLSGYIGAWGEGFLGGPEVRAFEEAWAESFGVKHAVSVNSATSGLIAAVGAAGIEPGAEIIVTPWTMAATATAILVWNAVPVFADIEPETFGLDHASVERLITSRTQAILVTDISGHAARLEELAAIASKHGLKLIEDAAQAPGALDNGRRVGTIGDIGVYSLNYHKHIHTGEGGVCVTDDEDLADRMRMIRNHAEAVAAGRRPADLRNLIGFNFRLGELESAIGSAQLSRLDELAGSRTRAGTLLTEGLHDLPGLQTPVVRNGCTHVYYIYPMVLDVGVLGVDRDWVLSALRAEGVPGVFAGYQNIHRLPLFTEKTAYGSNGFPWKPGFYDGEVSYGTGVCPVAERLHDVSMLGLRTCAFELADQEVGLVVGAFRKVWRAVGAHS